MNENIVDLIKQAAKEIAESQRKRKVETKSEKKNPKDS